MALLVDDYAYAKQLDLVIQSVPEKLAGVPNADLGSPEVMTPAELRTWLEKLALPV